MPARTHLSSHSRGAVPPTRRAGSCRLLALALLALGACSDAPAVAEPETYTPLRAALAAGDHSDALHLARRALQQWPEDGRLGLAAAEACLGLKRFSEAAGFAEGASGSLADAGDAGGELSADLQWAAGKARLALYLQLQGEQDWRAANSALERGAASAGSHRADAAYALIKMQGLGGLGNEQRVQRFGDLFLELEASGERADWVRSRLSGAND